MGNRSVIIAAITALCLHIGSTAAFGQGLSEPQALDYDVTGFVPPNCSAISGDIGTQITQALAGARPGDTRQVDFSLDCNKPFRVKVQSANGGLSVAGMTALDRAAAARDGLQAVLDYGVDLNVPYRSLSGSDERLISLCDTAAALKHDAPSTASCALGDDDGVVVPGMSLNQPGLFKINLATSDRPLVAGALSDTITIIIEAVR